MRERVGFIALVERSDLTFAEICERYEISRKTGYKLWSRYREFGGVGLFDEPAFLEEMHPLRRRVDEIGVAGIEPIGGQNLADERRGVHRQVAQLNRREESTRRFAFEN